MTLVPFLLQFLQQHKRKKNITNPTEERTECTATTFWKSVTFKTKSNALCSYNKSQQDAQFLKFI
jgi:hypothetical protein